MWGSATPPFHPRTLKIFVEAFLKVLCRKGSLVLENSNMKIQEAKEKEECNGDSNMNAYRITYR